MPERALGREDIRQRVAVVLGTRPGTIMFSPIIDQLQERTIPHFVLHSGQHYSSYMDSEIFEDLNLTEPDYRVEGVPECKTHGEQTARMLAGIEEVLLEERPVLVLVGGDANTNLAGALAARKLNLAVGHVEAGERSFDWRMPEEHNRRIIDHISDLLFATGSKARENLERESVRGEVVVTGNPIVDASVRNAHLAEERTDVRSKFGLDDEYLLLTLHREENVDFEDTLGTILEGVESAAAELQREALFLAHPRTLKRLKQFRFLQSVRDSGWLRLKRAVRYLEFQALLSGSSLVLTDSGGVQQEACIHKIPAVTLRESTEWTETVEIGANRIAGTGADKIRGEAVEAWRSESEWEIPFGDGNAAGHIVSTVYDFLERVADEGR